MVSSYGAMLSEHASYSVFLFVADKPPTWLSVAVQERSDDNSSTSPDFATPSPDS